jgi:hypothetical protein
VSNGLRSACEAIAGVLLSIPVSATILILYRRLYCNTPPDKQITETAPPASVEL